MSPARIIFHSTIILVLTAVGTLGATVEQRANQARRLKDDDSAALLAEMVRLEWRLNLHSADVCVVVVDASKSAEMKSKCDPLVAEYSFREYQKFLATICSAHGGKVHSTAGDGAVLAFPCCDEAFSAAREIQTSISYFNEHVNKMPSRFHLRVGMHTGRVSDDLSNIQFTEVIDVAAHVEAAAPVRGILMTRCVADMLPGVPLVPLKEPVDGHEVLLAYNPTVDA